MARFRGTQIGVESSEVRPHRCGPACRLPTTMQLAKLRELRARKIPKTLCEAVAFLSQALSRFEKRRTRFARR